MAKKNESRPERGGAGGGSGKSTSSGKRKSTGKSKPSGKQGAKISRKDKADSGEQRAATEDHNGNTTENRGSGGKWLPGHTPPGATPWKPGQSGNPKGRPKGKLLSDILREHLFEPVKGKDGKAVEICEGVVMTRADLIVRRAVEEAMEGSYFHLKEIFERIDGKVPNKVDANVNQKSNLADLLLSASRGDLPGDDGGGDE